MPASKLPTFHLSIPEPCHEDWNAMTPQDQGRHCSACQKVVVDFTLMSDQEVLHYFKQKAENVCGRFAPHQLDRDFRDKKKSFGLKWKYAWNMIVSYFLLAGSTANAQQRTASHKVTITSPVLDLKPIDPDIRGNIIIKNDRPAKQIAGIVLDDKDKPVSFASIQIKDVGGKAADEAGKFSFNNIHFVDSLVLMITAVGYEPKELVIRKKDTLNNLKIMLQPAVKELLPTVLVGYGIKGKVELKVTCFSTIKADTMVSTKAEKTGMPLNNTIRCYPNPLTAGQPLIVELSMPEVGNCMMEILTIEGKFLSSMFVDKTAAYQKVTMSTDSKWPAGMYILRINSNHFNKTYQAKIVLR